MDKNEAAISKMSVLLSTAVVWNIPTAKNIFLILVPYVKYNSIFLLILNSTACRLNGLCKSFTERVDYVKKVKQL